MNPLAEALLIFDRCPSPSLLPLLPQDPEAALGALMRGGGWLTENRVVRVCRAIAMRCAEETGVTRRIRPSRTRVPAHAQPGTSDIPGPRAPHLPNDSPVRPLPGPPARKTIRVP